MRCGNCGTENPHGAKFCKNCGNPLTEAASKPQGEASAAQQPGEASAAANTASDASAQTAQASGAAAAGGSAAGAAVSQVTDKIKGLPKNVLIAAAAGIVALIVIIFAVTSMGKTIKLDDYVSINTEGYDGYGNAWASIDWNAIEEKYGSKLKFTSEARKEYGGFVDMMSPVEVIEDHVSVDISWEPQAGKSGLSNGDVISYTWDIDDDVYDYVKCKLKFKDGEHEVTGLSEVGTFDAFADLVVSFHGIAPNGYAELEYNGSELSIYDFDMEDSDGLSNGDKIKVTIDESEIEYYAEAMGMVPAELEKEYTVEGLDSYLTSISQIDDAALESMQKQATDVYNAKVARDWDEGETLQSLTYIGDYLLIPKEAYLNSGELENHLFLVYKAQVRNNYTNNGQIYDQINSIYWYIRFDDLVVSADGSVKVDVTDYDTPNNRFEIDSGVDSGWWSTKSWYYYGYQTLDELYKDVVTAYLDTYDHEDNVNEAAAPMPAAEAGSPDETSVAEEDTQPDAEAQSAGAAGTETGYILPDSSTRLLSRADLEGLSEEDCRIARNEIYARHGRKFDDAELQAHFDACDWYEGSIAPDAFNEDLLSEIEVANKDLIIAYEEEMGYR